jgi:hypothetical protein
MAGVAPAKHARKTVDLQLINNLLDKYPDLKYTNTFYATHQYNSTEGNYIVDFISYQKSLIKKGYTLEKSFEIVIILERTINILD